MKKFILLIICFLSYIIFLEAQDKNKYFSGSNFELRGYLSNMQSVMINELDEQWINDNLFHNRLNFFWYAGNNLTASIQFRNRFMYGQTISLIPDYSSRIDKQDNFLDLSMNIFSGQSYVLNSTIDRLYLEYSLGKFVLTAGRQRINWAQTMVWNPNDVFNVQNYFEFDYPEKPGSDAIRIQYYPSFTSTAEIAASFDHNNKLTAAGYYRFNKWGYDFQALGGILAEDDFFGGIGWSGDIEGAGFRGELSYFHPKKKFVDTSGLLISSVSLDYTFSNSLYLQLEGLYSEKPRGQYERSFYEYYQGSLNVKNMSFSELNLFFQVSYPFTPLLNGSISLMYFPDIKGIYSGPSINYSLSNNSEVTIISQIFNGEFSNPMIPGSSENQRNTIFFGYVRYKFSF